jgi:hypothetical protein
VDSGLVTGFIRLAYKPRQIKIAGNSFFYSTGNALGLASSTAFA